MIEEGVRMPRSREGLIVESHGLRLWMWAGWDGGNGGRGAGGGRLGRLGNRGSCASGIWRAGEQSLRKM